MTTYWQGSKNRQRGGALSFWHLPLELPYAQTLLRRLSFLGLPWLEGLLWLLLTVLLASLLGCGQRKEEVLTCRLPSLRVTASEQKVPGEAGARTWSGGSVDLIDGLVLSIRCRFWEY